MFGLEACKRFEWASRDDTAEVKHHCPYRHPLLPEVHSQYDGKVAEPAAFCDGYDQWPSTQRRPRVCRSGGAQGAVGQLSSRTLRVSTCCWKATALPPSIVHTWTIFTTAGSPELLCFHL